MLETVFNYAERFIVCVSPIVVAIFAWRTAVSQKKTKEFMQLQAKYNAAEKELQKTESDAQKAVIEGLSNDMQILQRQVSALSQSLNLDGVHTQLEKISTMTKINYDYSQTISQVICTIGKCIEESTTPENKQKITDALQKHQEKEHDISNQLCNVAL